MSESENEQLRFSNEELGISIPVPRDEATPVEQAEAKEELLEDNPKSQEELELETREEAKERLYSILESRKFKVKNKFDNALAQIYQLKLDKLGSKPISEKENIIFTALIREFPDKEDRALLIEALKDKQKEVLEKLDTDEMKRIEATGQERFYPEYQRLVYESAKIADTVQFLRGLEDKIKEIEAEEKVEKEALMDEFLNQSHTFFIGKRFYEITIRQALPLMKEDIDFNIGLDYKQERTEEEKNTKRSEYSYDILKYIPIKKIPLLIKILKDDPELTRYIPLIEEII